MPAVDGRRRIERHEIHAVDLKYLLLIDSDERNLSQPEMDRIYAGHRLYGEAMNTAGVMRGGAELKPAQRNRPVHEWKPGPQLDGPFAETKEQLGGYT